MATILLVCFGNAIGDWKMQMGIEKSTRLSSWLIAGPWSCKNDSSCGAWSLDSRIWWRNHARPHYVAKLNSFLTWRSMISLPNTLRRNLYSMGKEIQIKCTTNLPLRFVEHCFVFVSFKKDESIDPKYENLRRWMNLVGVIKTSVLTFQTSMMRFAFA